MTAPSIHGNRSIYSASVALDAIGKALGEIKAQDGLTWSDIGAVLGKSEDQAAKYADGSATMDAITFGRGKKEWNGRFTGYFDRLCVDSRPSGQHDRERETHVLKAVLALSIALADDDEVSAHEVRANRTTIENARDALEELLRKAGPVEVRA